MLDEQKRRKIIAVLMNGSSRRTAAGYVGCASTTIMRTMDRDPEFARAVVEAEQHAEIEALQMLRRAGREEKHWRAAAWLLERKNPEDFARRPHNSLSMEQIAQMFALLVGPILDRLSDDEFYETFQRLEELTRRIRKEIEHAEQIVSSRTRIGSSAGRSGGGFATLSPPGGGGFATSPPPADGGFATSPDAAEDRRPENAATQTHAVEAVQVVPHPPAGVTQ